MKDTNVNLGSLMQNTLCYYGIIVPYVLYKIYMVNSSRASMYIPIYARSPNTQIYKEYKLELPIYALFNEDYFGSTKDKYKNNIKNLKFEKVPKIKFIRYLLKVLNLIGMEYKPEDESEKVGYKFEISSRERSKYNDIAREFSAMLECEISKKTGSITFEGSIIKINQLKGLKLGTELHKNNILNIIRRSINTTKFLKLHAKSIYTHTSLTSSHISSSSSSEIHYYVSHLAHKTITYLEDNEGHLELFMPKFEEVATQLFREFHTNMEHSYVTSLNASIISSYYKGACIEDVLNHIEGICALKDNTTFFKKYLRKGVKDAAMPSSYGAGFKKQYDNIIINYTDKLTNYSMLDVDNDIIIMNFAGLTRAILKSQDILSFTSILRNLHTSFILGVMSIFGAPVYNHIASTNYECEAIYKDYKHKQSCRTSFGNKKTFAIVRRPTTDIDYEASARSCTVNHIHSIDSLICSQVINSIANNINNKRPSVLPIHDCFMSSISLYNSIGLEFNKSLYSFFRGPMVKIFDDLMPNILVLMTFRFIFESITSLDTSQVKTTFSKIRKICSENYILYGEVYNSRREEEDIVSETSIKHFINNLAYYSIEITNFDNGKPSIEAEISHLVSNSYYYEYINEYSSANNIAHITYEEFMEDDGKIYKQRIAEIPIRRFNPIYLHISYHKYKKLYIKLLDLKYTSKAGVNEIKSTKCLNNNYTISTEKIVSKLQVDIFKLNSESKDLRSKIHELDKFMDADQLSFLTYKKEYIDIIKYTHLYNKCATEDGKEHIRMSFLKYITMKNRDSDGNVYKNDIYIASITNLEAMHAYKELVGLNLNIDLRNIINFIYLIGSYTEYGFDKIFNIADPSRLPPHSTTSS